MSTKLEKADLAAGCFWGIQEALDQLSGVVKTEVGYEGGSTDNPTYEQVCSYTTGHAETVQVIFDPTKLSYKELLAKFFELHDPTQANGQGLNIGDNYRSAIFYHSDEQKNQAQQIIQKLGASLTKPIVTQVVKAQTFWPAEDYHQNYYAKQ